MIIKETEEVMAAEVDHLNDHKAIKIQPFHLNLDELLVMMRKCVA